MKSACVTVIGRPSSGKSSLINALCGRKVSIVSNVPQTTRNRIRGIYTDQRGQLVFLDTPGFYSSEKKLNLHLQRVIKEALAEVDLVLYLIDVTRPPGVEEMTIMGLVEGFSDRLVVVLNKTDAGTGARDAILAQLKATFGDASPLEISALTGTGTKELLALLFERAPQGENLYPAEFYTDQEPAFRIAEIVREKVIAHTREEVPHAVYIEIADMEMRDEGARLWVRGFICVERDSQKGIVIGRGGEKIRAIMTEAQAELAELFPYRVELDFRVRVRQRWRRNESLLKRLIY